MIRKTKESDLKGLRKIIFTCAKILKWNNKDKKWLRRTYTIKNLKKDIKKSDFFVICRKNKVIASGRLEKDRLWTVYVDPKFHRRGFGTKILNFLQRVANKNGIKKLKLYAADTAIGFYKKMGFKLKNKKNNEMVKILK
jgi:N-acetylglutamate synthase-like GNAT family acetyltransferase